jgi:cytoskeletal protein RodZ
MTLPRPVLIALLGVALCAAAFLATRSANDTNSAVTTVSPAPQPTQTHRVTTPATKHAAPTAKAKAHKAAPTATRNEPTVQKSQAATQAPAKPAAPTTPAKPAKPAVSPEVARTLPAIKALARGDVVVFFFTHPGPADDTGTRAAVHSLKGEKGVSVFTVGLNQLETYGPVLNGAGVSQVPAIVVVRAGQKGRLLQGYVDSQTLHQTVADARR